MSKSLEDLSVEELARTLQMQMWHGKPVLVLNSDNGNGKPVLFRLGSVAVEVRPEQFITIRNSGSTLYVLNGGIWHPDRCHDWGRNFFPGKDSYIVVGAEGILSRLKEAHGYTGELPRDLSKPL